MSVAEFSIEEFKALRAEHDARVGKQHDISNLAVALMTLIVAALALSIKTGSTTSLSGSGYLAIAVPVGAILLLALNLMILDHEMNIVHIQFYIQKTLFPRIAPQVPPAATEWIYFRAAQQQGNSIVSRIGSLLPSAKYALCLLPSLAAIATTPLAISTTTQKPDEYYFFAWTIFALAIVFLLVTIVGIVYSSLLYIKLART